jgi:hypothetical protein
MAGGCGGVSGAQRGCIGREGGTRQKGYVLSGVFVIQGMYLPSPLSDRDIRIYLP